MKNLFTFSFILSFLTLFLISCKESNEEISKRRKLRLELMSEFNKLKNNHKKNKLIQETNEVTNISSKKHIDNTINHGTIIGENVIIRNNHSTTSKIIGSIKSYGERIQILEHHSPKKVETLIKKDVSVKTTLGNPYLLERGKSVEILEYLNNSKVKVKFIDQNLKKQISIINNIHLDKNVSSNWYKIKRKNGEIGWVFGKFISLENRIFKSQ